MIYCYNTNYDVIWLFYFCSRKNGHRFSIAESKLIQKLDFLDIYHNRMKLGIPFQGRRATLISTQSGWSDQGGTIIAQKINAQFKPLAREVCHYHHQQQQRAAVHYFTKASLLRHTTEVSRRRSF